MAAMDYIHVHDRLTSARAVGSTAAVTNATNFLTRLPRKRSNVGQQFTDEDGPGHLSRTGPRHDNDHQDYRMIKILPTADEILATSRPQYMPKKNCQESHFLAPGPSRLLDIHFRHLRYDNTESIRDILYSAAQLSFLDDHRHDRNNSKPILETEMGNRYYMYSDVRVEELLPDEKKGILVRFTFECPPALRGQLMHKSARLESGMLCAIMLRNRTTQNLSVIYFDILLKQSTYSLKHKGHTTRAAVQLSFHNNASHEDILPIIKSAHGLDTETEMVLVEFPKVLYLGFFNPLHRLQQMKPEELAFHNYLAPDHSKDYSSPRIAIIGRMLNHEVPPPSYASDPDFCYDLSPITGKESDLPTKSLQTTSSQSSFDHIAKDTTLDQGQAGALRDSLSRELVFIQGPPGTGKTFLGVALTRVLLASRRNRTHKPIVVVCLTNHALDSFLHGLKDAGVDGLLRIGGGSKEEWTRAINLTQKSRGQGFTSNENQDKCGVMSQEKSHFNELVAWCNAITARISTNRIQWLQIEPVLRKHYPMAYIQLMTDVKNVFAQSFAFDYWAAGGDIDHLHELHKELEERLNATTRHQRDHKSGSDTDLQAKENIQKIIRETLQSISDRAVRQSTKAGGDDLWQLPYQSRQSLLLSWSHHIDHNELAKDMAYMQTQYQDLISAKREIRDQRDIRTLSRQNVIGLTTTGCAGRWELLRNLAPEILVCEEAGEVLEAHALCALLPSIKHAIFIGDPLQLRPLVNEQSMTIETPIGMQYRLDESLFERFMLPVDPGAMVMPTSQLSIQRRMHPQIADVTRLTYPFLKDHESTGTHPSVKGLADRTFWLDHVMWESSTDLAASDSVFNKHEVEIVKALVQYLLRGSEYSMGEIAVLTPYAAQLSKLVTSLQATCPIWLSDTDKEILIDNGEVDFELEDVKARTNVKMEEMLRCATIDNFQGEEAKVIILSTVRSGGKVGFLKTPNRINVACSRARDGFYIIGNAETLSQVPLWKKIINTFDQKALRGPALHLQCSRHAGHSTHAKVPSDFANFAICEEECGVVLKCGHACHEACHDPILHDRMPCNQPCDNVFDCGHSCGKKCADKCGVCTRSTSGVQLDCGHTGSKVCSGQVLDCKEVIETKTLSCGVHTIDVVCGQKKDTYECHSLCNNLLPCGHFCAGMCDKCTWTGNHPECAENCGKHLSCGHKCTALCHDGEICPPCRAPCEKSCPHSACSNTCAEPCDPCTRLITKGAAVHDRSKIVCCLRDIDIASVREVFDRLLRKVARRMNRFTGLLETEVQSLDHSFGDWTEKIGSNTLAANSNMRHVLAREVGIINIQDQIVVYRGTVDAIERSMKALHDNNPDEGLDYTSMLHVRLSVLEFRSLHIRFDDKFRVINYLLKVKNQSQEMQRQAIQMLQFVLTECVACSHYCQSVIKDHQLVTSPFIECEARLHQVRLHLLACYARDQLLSVEMNVTVPESLATSDQPLKSLERTEDISKHYPLTNKGLLVTCVKYRERLVSSTSSSRSNSKNERVPSILPSGGHEIEKLWSKYETGYLVTTCKYKHPYSSITFRDGCPECGKWSETEEVLQKRAEEKQRLIFKTAQDHLQEDAFLAMLDKMSGSKL